MKKLMTILAAFAVAATPLVASAETTWATYDAGEEVNFYMYEGDTVGTSTIILEDKGNTDQYVKALMIGGTTGSGMYDDGAATDDDPTDFYNTYAATTALSAINEYANGWTYAKDLATTFSFITLDELKTVFGATDNGSGKYIIDVAKYGDVFDIYAGSKGGFWTSTIDAEAGTGYVVKVARAEDDTVEAITVETANLETDAYDYVTVLSLDKTYDCTERDLSKDKDYACYSCDSDYSWLVVGEQADTCTLVENVSSKADCAKNPDTGIKSYLVEFLVVAGVCAAALVIVKKKDLFRNI